MGWNTLSGIAGIVLINLVLSGDNALVIGMASRHLAARQRRWAFLWGTVGAIVLRLALTWPAAMLLNVAGLSSVGGVLLVWIAMELLVRPPGKGKEVEASQSLTEAIRIIIFADIIMSLDNVLAVGALSHGDLVLLIFGIALSMPILMGGAALVAYLLSRHSWLIWLGGGLLAWVAGEMIVKDPLIKDRLETVWPALQQFISLRLLIPLLITLAVVLISFVWVRRKNQISLKSEQSALMK